MEEIIREMVLAMEKEQDVALISIVADSGSTPRGTGAKMLVFSDGRIVGTIGGGAIEFASQKMAQDVLKQRASRLQEFDLSPSDMAHLGMICGGRATVFIQYVTHRNVHDCQTLTQARQLLDSQQPFALLTCLSGGDIVLITPTENPFALLRYQDISKAGSYLHKTAEHTYLVDPVSIGGRALLFGMGHVGAELAFLLNRLKFYTVAMDDRAEFLTPERLPTANERREVNFPTSLAGLNVTEEDYIVILTRGHQHDYSVLHQALETPARYIGMIGSRNKVAMTLKKLKEDGFSQDAINRLYAPVGIPLGGDSPEEIAVSIAAEMIRVRSDYRG